VNTTAARPDRLLPLLLLLLLLYVAWRGSAA